MDPVDLAFAGVARQAQLMRSGEVTSRELTELYLERIERIDPELNAYRVVMAEEALAAADAADQRRGNGEDKPLLGVPIAVKDTTDVAGQITALGTGGFDTPAKEDSALVSRLRDAGAVILGKTNLPELAVCGFTESKTWGATRNPWSPAHTTAGSSGGSGAAVAAGLCAAAHASDGMGSIRFPAANCRLFGLKPQRDRVTMAPHRGEDEWYGLSVNGFLTRSVLDTGLLLDVATSGEQMPGAPPPPEVSFAQAAASDPGKLRIAYTTRAPRLVVPTKVNPQLSAALESTVELLRSQGHELAEAHPPYGSTMGNRIVARFLGGARFDFKNVPHPEKLEERTRGFARLGGLVGTKGALEKACGKGLERDQQRLGKLFEDYDVLITPTTAQPPVEVGRWEGKGALRTLIGMNGVYPFGGTWNHTGQPACSVPAGFDTNGLPLGVMMIGRPNAETTLLSLAAQIEAARPWAQDRPQLATRDYGERSGSVKVESVPAPSSPPSEPT